jgi:hypothetical protein
VTSFEVFVVALRPVVQKCVLIASVGSHFAVRASRTHTTTVHAASCTLLATDYGRVLLVMMMRMRRASDLTATVDAKRVPTCQGRSTADGFSHQEDQQTVSTECCSGEHVTSFTRGCFSWHQLLLASVGVNCL